MSSAPTAASRWTDSRMVAHVRRRNAAERRFRMLGFFAVGLSVLFLVFLLVTMAWRGLGGFTQTEAALTIDFPRSDLMLDPAALRGAQAREALGGAGLDGVLSTAATQQFGAAGEELFSDGAVRTLGN